MNTFHFGKVWIGLLFGALSLLLASPAQGAVLWRHSKAYLACRNDPGEDVLRGTIKPLHENSDSTLYFRFSVDPISDSGTKSMNHYYEAGFALFEGDVRHFGIGDAWRSWGYSAFGASGQGRNNDVSGEFDLLTANPELGKDYELVRRGIVKTIVFKVQYFPHQNAHVTIWFDPDLSGAASEVNQATNIITRFEANARFDQIRLIHRGAGDGWIFKDMAIATSFEDFIQPPFWQRWWFLGLAGGGILFGVGGTVHVVERRRSKAQIERLERERAVATERARIARDIHDELGAELAQIGLLADCGGDQGPHADAEQKFARIARRARSLVLAMDEIVWAVDPRNDNLSRVADYLCQMADDCFGDSNIRCRRDVPKDLPGYPIAAEVRHDVTLAVKEAFTNILKHSGATEMRLVVNWQEPELVITVEDNGCGFKVESAGQGNGLSNQRTRLERNGGKVELQSSSGNGTRIIFTIQISPSQTPRRATE